MTELESLSGIKRRTIEKYRRLGLLPDPVGKGRAARWPEAAMTILRRIKAEVLDSRVTLAEFAERLDYERGSE